MKESAVESHIRYDAASLGNPLWRNNVGVAWQGDVKFLDDGSVLIQKPRPVRYGLCNESKQQNQNFKSSDWVGPTPVLIQEHHLNTVIGVFTAIEAKHSGWVFNSSDKHCLAQKNFHDIVIGKGGFAGFASSKEDYRKIIKNVT